MVTSDKWPDKKSAEMQERVKWHKVVVWNKQGKTCADHMKKDAAVYIHGELRTYSREKEDCEKAFVTVIKPRKVKFL